MIRATCLLAAALIPVTSYSNVIINLNAEILRNADGSLMPSSGLVLLAASTQNPDFAEPSDTEFLPGFDDIILGKWSLGSNDGRFGAEFNGVLSGSWSSGDHLRLYWYPTLTEAATEPGAGTPYGTYRSDIPDVEESSSGWFTPNDGATESIGFFTADSGGPGGNDGRALLTTPVPEPSFYAGAFAAGCLAWAVAKRRKQRNLA